MSHQPDDVASAVAAAFLDGAWTARGLLERGAQAAGVTAKRLRPTVAAVLGAYRDPPGDRRRELARFILHTEDFHRQWRHKPFPRVAHFALPEARTIGQRWPVPRLDSVQDLADWADLTVSDLDWYADVKSLERAASPRLRHYDADWVYGRRGTVRLLERPRPKIKGLQRRVLHEILDLVPVHDAAHGFVAHRSVVSFAAPHAGRDTVVRLDLSAFFARITAGRVFGVIRSIGYPEAVAHSLTGLLTTATSRDVLRSAPQALRDGDLGSRRRLLNHLAHPHLPQGAPTSPAIANLAAFRLDVRLAGLAAAADARYSRYADDLAFSLDGPASARRARRLVDTVRTIVRAEDFRLNDAKTSVIGNSQRQRLCGVVVNQTPGVARRERDELRALLHNCCVHGPASQNRAGLEDFRSHLLGRIAWVTAVNPDQGARLHAQFDAITWSEVDR